MMDSPVAAKMQRGKEAKGKGRHKGRATRALPSTLPSFILSQSQRQRAVNGTLVSVSPSAVRCHQGGLEQKIRYLYEPG